MKKIGQAGRVLAPLFSVAFVMACGQASAQRSISSDDLRPLPISNGQFARPVNNMDIQGLSDKLNDVISLLQELGVKLWGRGIQLIPIGGLPGDVGSIDAATAKANLDAALAGRYKSNSGRLEWVPFSSEDLIFRTGTQTLTACPGCLRNQCPSNHTIKELEEDAEWTEP